MSVSEGCICAVQFDIHSPGATVHEALLFSAQLRLIDVRKDKMRRFVDEVGPPLLPCDPAALESGTWRYPSDSEYSVFRVIWRRVHCRWLMSLQCGQHSPMRNPVFTDLNIILGPSLLGYFIVRHASLICSV